MASVHVAVGDGGISVTHGGRRLTAPDPRRSQPRRLPPQPEEQTLYLVESPLGGYGLARFVRSLPGSSAVIAIELDAELAPIARHPAAEPVSGHRFSRAASAADALGALERLLPLTGIRRIVRIAMSGGARLHAAKYAELAATAHAIVLRFWRNRGTEIRLFRRWITNLARNGTCDAVAPSAIAANLGRSVVLVGAGPSLDLHHDTLRLIAARPNSQAIVALDTALPALAAIGVMPRAVVSMDAQLANARDFLPWRWDGIALLADATCHPSIVRRFPAERRALFMSEFAQDTLFNDPDIVELVGDLPRIPPLGSVAPAALEVLARHMGVVRILLVGIDFHYRAPRTHARMSAIDRAMRRIRTRISWPSGNDAALARPVTEAIDRHGALRPADLVLADHAERMRDVIAHLERDMPHLTVATLPGDGLEIGCRTIEPRQAGEFLARITDTDHLLSDVARAASDRSAGSPPLAKHAALARLIARLRTLERQLAAEGDAYLDAGLEFVARDLPQWPLMRTRRDWFELQRGRVLRSVRDYRRRLDRILASVNPPSHP